MSRKDNEKKETKPRKTEETSIGCLLYTSDAADEL